MTNIMQPYEIYIKNDVNMGITVLTQNICILEYSIPLVPNLRPIVTCCMALCKLQHLIVKAFFCKEADGGL